MNISLNFREAAYGPETGQVLICLFTIEHESLSEPIRLSTDPTERLEQYTTDHDVVYGTVSRGETYIFFPISLRPPGATESGPGEMRLEIDNVHRTYMEVIRNIVSPPRVTVEIVLSDALDVVEVRWPEYLLQQIQYDALTISGTLTLETLSREAFPSGTFTPSSTPGVF